MNFESSDDCCMEKNIGTLKHIKKTFTLQSAITADLCLRLSGVLCLFSDEILIKKSIKKNLKINFQSHPVSTQLFVFLNAKSWIQYLYFGLSPVWVQSCQCVYFSLSPVFIFQFESNVYISVWVQYFYFSLRTISWQVIVVLVIVLVVRLVVMVCQVTSVVSSLMLSVVQIKYSVVLMVTLVIPRQHQNVRMVHKQKYQQNQLQFQLLLWRLAGSPFYVA